MFDTLSWILGIDEFSVLQIITLTAVCGFIVSQIFPGWMAATFCNIGLFASALITNVVLRKFAVVITYNRDLDGIIFTTIGLTGGAVLAIGTILTLSALSHRVGVTPQKLREQFDASRTAD